MSNRIYILTFLPIWLIAEGLAQGPNYGGFGSAEISTYIPINFLSVVQILNYWANSQIILDLEMTVIKRWSCINYKMLNEHWRGNHFYG